MHAHHDGSSLYVSTRSPRLGEPVTLWLRVADAGDPPTVWVRSAPDAEPWYDAAECVGEQGGWWWYRASVMVHNPVMRYRWLLSTGDGYAWFTGAGLVTHDVPDDQDFTLLVSDPAPEWVTDAVVYQVFPDRFARSDAADERSLPAWAVASDWEDPVEQRRPDVAYQVYGGDLDGVSDKLDYLEDLGVDVIYLTPFFPAGSSHRYDSTTFSEVDPLLGGDDALARLTSAAHARGMRVMGDLTTNHSGWEHEWFLAAQADVDAAERDLYFMQPDGSYVGWYALETLPKFRPSDEFFARLIDGADSVARRWLAPPFQLDGWRIDVANMTGRQGEIDANAEVAHRLRAAMLEERSDAYLVAEHCHDASADLRAGGWHGAMNYAGFLRPLWSWLRYPGYRSNFLGLPANVPRSSGASAVATVTAFIAATPWREMTASWSLIGSHDTARVRTVLGDCAGVAAGILFTFPGVPMMFMGDEWGGEGVDGEDSRRPMPWDRPDSRDPDTFERYRSLIALRRASTALREGGLRWVHASDDAISYVREHLDETVWCVAVRGGTQRVTVPSAVLGLAHGDDAELVFGKAELAVADGEVRVTLTGPAFVAWRLPGATRPVAE